MIGAILISGLLQAATPPPAVFSHQPSIPASQLLTWCKSGEATEFAYCYGYILGALEGVEISSPPNETYDIQIGTSTAIIDAVVNHIEAMPRETLSENAAIAVRDAIHSAFPPNVS